MADQRRDESARRLIASQRAYYGECADDYGDVSCRVAGGRRMLTDGRQFEIVKVFLPAGRARAAAAVARLGDQCATRAGETFLYRVGQPERG